MNNFFNKVVLGFLNMCCILMGPLNNSSGLFTRYINKYYMIYKMKCMSLEEFNRFASDACPFR